MEITHIRLLVDNYKECFLFYRDVLGLNVSWGNETSNYADFITEGGAKLGIFERKQMMETIGSEYEELSSVNDKTTVVLKVGSVEEAYNKFIDSIEFITKPHEQKGWGLKVVHFRDPAGNLIELYENL